MPCAGESALCSAPVQRDYRYYAQALEGRSLPAALVDLDLLRENAAALVARAGGKPLRLATKSVRCTALLRLVLREYAAAFAASWPTTRARPPSSWRRASRDILVAYPALDAPALTEVARRVAAGAQVTFTVDAPGHVTAAARAARRGRHRAAAVHRRGPLARAARPALRRAALAAHHSRRRARARRVHPRDARRAARGPDRLRGADCRRAGPRALRAPAERRGAPAQAPLAAATSPRAAPPCCTRCSEAGFALALRERGRHGQPRDEQRGAGGDGGRGGQRPLRAHRSSTATRAFAPPRPPSSRCPSRGCRARASTRCTAAATWPRARRGGRSCPRPSCPRARGCSRNEGAGEVQTPVRYEGPERLVLGSPVFFRHAKAGELCEHFNALLLVSGGAVVRRGADLSRGGTVLSRVTLAQLVGQRRRRTRASCTGRRAWRRCRRSVRGASARGLGVRVAGSGHSFSPLVATEDVDALARAAHGPGAGGPRGVRGHGVGRHAAAPARAPARGRGARDGEPRGHRPCRRSAAR